VARPFKGETKHARRNFMKFLSVYKTVERDVPPSQEEMARMGKLIEEGMKAGYLLAVEGCLPSALGARVRLSNGKMNVTDGPFTEAKEVIGGFALFQVNSKAEAIEHARQFLQVVGGGECELRQLYEADQNTQARSGG
jgi:hypothetical protein